MPPCTEACKPLDSLTSSPGTDTFARLFPGVSPTLFNANTEPDLRHEENVSAKQYSPQAYPRVPRPHGDEAWTAGSEGPSGQGPRASDAVSAGSDGISGLGFPRSLRLLKSREFALVFREGFASKDRYFTLIARRNGTGQPRLGLAVSRKVAPKAVVRNRLKRLIRESFRIHRSELRDMDIVAMARTAAVTTDNERLYESLARHWQRLNSKCDAS